MPSDFDRALANVQAQRAAAEGAERNKALEVQRNQRHVRQIAEPYLRELAPQVQQKLLDLKVPLHRYTVPESGWGWWGWFKSVRRYWTFRSGILYVTEDGYFVTNNKLPGPEGFEAMLRQIQLVSKKRYLYDGIFVDEESRSLVIVITRREEPTEIVPLGDWLAQRVLELHAEADRQRN